MIIAGRKSSSINTSTTNFFINFFTFDFMNYKMSAAPLSSGKGREKIKKN